jgi:hypothetical protein
MAVVDPGLAFFIGQMQQGGERPAVLTTNKIVHTTDEKRRFSRYN